MLSSAYLTSAVFKYVIIRIFDDCNLQTERPLHAIDVSSNQYESSLFRTSVRGLEAERHLSPSQVSVGFRTSASCLQAECQLRVLSSSRAERQQGMFLVWIIPVSIGE